jgi:hypothetical protein
VNAIHPAEDKGRASVVESVAYWPENGSARTLIRVSSITAAQPAASSCSMAGRLASNSETSRSGPQILRPPK